VRCGSFSVYSVLRFWRTALYSTSHPALELGFCCVGFLGACFFASLTFSGARSEICQHVMLVCWLFLNFAVSFDFGFCSLIQMSFVDHYLPYFRQWLITCLLTVSPLLKVHAEISFFLLQCAQSTLSPLLHVPFQFLVYYSVFF
jgi:hypothetical protein